MFLLYETSSTEAASSFLLSFYHYKLQRSKVLQPRTQNQQFFCKVSSPAVQTHVKSAQLQAL